MNIENNEHYKLMGCDSKGKFIIRCRKPLLTNPFSLTHPFSAKDLGKQGVLESIAPLDFWAQFPGISSAINREDLLTIQSNIMHATYAKGIYELPTDILGRGAAKDSRGILVFNAGNKLYQQSHSRSETLDEVIDIFDSIDDNFEIGAPIEVADDTSQGEDYCRALCRALMRYRWEEPNDGVIFCGWIVTALIGGALPYRPAIWINAPTEAGKTYLFTKLSTILKSMVLKFGDANVTEARIAKNTRSDSLAVLLDEFESAGGFNKEQRKIMVSTHIATSFGGGLRLRGGNSKTKAIKLRFSTAFASRNHLNREDRWQIYHVNLSHKGVDDWESVKADIENIVTPEKCLVIRSHIIKNLPKIINLFEKWEGVYSKDESDNDARSVSIRSTLGAGYEFLSGEATRIQSKKYW